MLLAALPADLLGAVPTSLALAAFGLLIGAALGAGLCAARLSSGPVLRRATAGLIHAIRLVPPLLWLLLAFHAFGEPPAPGAFAAAAAGLGLISGARLADAGRHALATIATGQWEAAAALHLPARTLALEIVGPQLLRALRPVLAAEAIVLLRDSTLASLVGVEEIAAVAQGTTQPGPSGLVALGAAAALFLVLELPLAALSRRAGPPLRAGIVR